MSINYPYELDISLMYALDEAETAKHPLSVLHFFFLMTEPLSFRWAHVCPAKESTSISQTLAEQC